MNLKEIINKLKESGVDLKLIGEVSKGFNYSYLSGYKDCENNSIDYFTGCSIHKINFDRQEREVLYDCISNVKDIYLLSQLAMSNKKDSNDLIFISAGWNKGIEKVILKDIRKH